MLIIRNCKFLAPWSGIANPAQHWAEPYQGCVYGKNVKSEK